MWYLQPFKSFEQFNILHYVFVLAVWVKIKLQNLMANLKISLRNTEPE